MELADFLAGHNVTVSLPTLPGHGTHAADLFNYRWQDWFDCVKTEHRRLAKVCDEVFVCGLSMGGTLALHLAAHRPVQGVIALAAAVQFPPWQKYGVRLAKNIIKFRRKKSGEDVHDGVAKAKLGSYRRYPYYAVDQFFQLVEHVRAELPEIEQPLLIVHSPGDHTVDFENAQIIFDSVASTHKRKVELQDSFHVITVDVEKELVQQEVIAFLREHSALLKKPAVKRAKPKRKPTSKTSPKSVGRR